MSVMEENHSNCIHYFVCGLIAFLIAAMLVGVVYDRREFHNRVYEAAYQSAYSMKCKYGDSIIDSSKVSIDSSIVNISYSGQPVDEYTLLDTLSKSDGLLSANGLTYLVTLIVALLASLLLTKIDAMEKATSAYNELKVKLDNAMTTVNESTNTLYKIKRQQKEINIFKTKISQSLTEIRKQQKDIGNFEEKIGAYFKKITYYDHILNRIASVFNLSIMISNITLSLSNQRNKRNNNINATEAGALSSRLSLICDQIDIHVLDYLTTDEKIILITYLDDALNGLKNSLKRADLINCEHLHNRIEDNISCIKDIIENIDSVEVREM